MTQSNLQSCVPELLSWYEQHARPLPFRENPSAYRVWISEVMLQQTRIEAAIPHYHAFLRQMPDLTALANAPTEVLMKCWEGLGYYSRARNLQRAAQQVLESGRRELPSTYAELVKLPGIGVYTAGAIASIAYGERVPAVDGNVMRILARLTASYTDVLSPAGKKEFSALAASLVPEDEPGEFNQALMELGETVCLPHAVPRCDACPLAQMCEAHRQGIEEQLPVRKQQKERRIEKRTVFVLKTKGEQPLILLHRRPSTGLLAGLYEFPNVTGRLTDLQAQNVLNDLGLAVETLRRLPRARHLFTHIEWQMSGFGGVVSHAPLPPDYHWVTREEMQKQHALPSAFRSFLPFIHHMPEEES